MRCSIVLLLVAAFCWCKTLHQLPPSSSYVVEDGVFKTNQVGTIPIPLQERLTDSAAQEILRIRASLNGGAVGLIFAKSSSTEAESTAEEESESSITETVRSLLWYVNDIGEDQLSVQLCIDSQRRSCYAPQTLSGFVNQFLNIQVEARKEVSDNQKSYLRFWISLFNDGTERTTLSQVFKLDNFPVTGDWTLELEQRKNTDQVSLSDVAVVDRDAERMDVLLWDGNCWTNEDYISLYQDITGASTEPDMDYYRPSGCDPEYQGFIEDRWGNSGNDVCTLTKEGETYKFESCTGPANLDSTDNQVPGWCFRDVTGNFDFSVKVESIGYDKAFLSAFVVSESNAAKGSYLGILSTQSKIQFRTKDGDTKVSKPSGSNSSPVVEIRVERSGDVFKMYSRVDGNDWIREPTSTSSFEMEKLVDPVDCCVLYFQNEAGTGQEAVFSAPTLVLKQDIDQ